MVEPPNSPSTPQTTEPSSGKRKPGRPRGSRNRKPSPDLPRSSLHTLRRTHRRPVNHTDAPLSSAEKRDLLRSLHQVYAAGLDLMKNYDTRIPTDALPQDIPSRLLRAEDSIRNALEVFPDSWHLGNQLKSIRHQAKALLEPTYAEMREKKPELYEYLIQRNGFAAGINLSNDAIEAERSFFGHLDALIERVGLPVVILPQALFCTKTGELKYVYFNAKDEELGNMTIIIDLLNKKSIFCSKEWVDPRRFPVGFDTLVEVPSENRGDIIDYVKANLLEQFKTPKCLTPLESLRPKP